MRDTLPKSDALEESEQLSRHVIGNPPDVHYHYSQSKNGNGNEASKTNTILLGCLLAIVGFMGIQVWMMNGRMAAFEATLNLLVARSGIANPP